MLRSFSQYSRLASLLSFSFNLAPNDRETQLDLSYGRVTPEDPEEKAEEHTPRKVSKFKVSWGEGSLTLKKIGTDVKSISCLLRNTS
jgi:hypothetical protein